VPGVIHVGANVGQERTQYAALGLNVIWVEPIPAVFDELSKNISAFPKQRAYCSLLAAELGKEYTLHVANNGGASSSILDFSKHGEIWPDVHYVQDLKIVSTTLSSLIRQEEIDLRQYGALVLDTQGSELLVLQGAVPVLREFQFVKTEVADFDSYAGCCQLEQLSGFMREHDFELYRKMAVATKRGVGKYYDAVYRRM